MTHFSETTVRFVIFQLKQGAVITALQNSETAKASEKTCTALVGTVEDNCKP